MLVKIVVAIALVVAVVFTFDLHVPEDPTKAEIKPCKNKIYRSENCERIIFHHPESRYIRSAPPGTCLQWVPPNIARAKHLGNRKYRFTRNYKSKATIHLYEVPIGETVFERKCEG